MVIHQCVKCNKEFQYPWMLRRHLERKYQCIVDQVNVSNEPKEVSNEPSEVSNEHLVSEMVSNGPNSSKKVSNGPKKVSFEPSKVSNGPQNGSFEPSKVSDGPSKAEVSNGPCETQCIYCMKKFFRKQECKKHLASCKMKDDPIRQLEMKAKVEFEPPPPNTCRFCKIQYSNSSHLSRHLRTCKEIEIYKEQLQLKVQHITNNTTNNTNCTLNNDYSTTNNIQNNITINAIGSETINHIALEKVTQMLIKQGKEFVEESVYLISGNVVIEYQKMLREIPENRNLIIPSWRSPRALIKTPGSNEFIKMEIGEALDTSFRNTAKMLLEKIDEIKEVRGGFSNEQTHEMHNLVKFLGSHGIKFAPFGQTHNRNEVKRRFKAANMECSSTSTNDL